MPNAWHADRDRKRHGHKVHSLSGSTERLDVVLVPYPTMHRRPVSLLLTPTAILRLAALLLCQLYHDLIHAQAEA